MGYHTFDAEQAAKLEDAQRRYRFLSVEELLWSLSLDGVETVADLGSGTGFYTDDVALATDRVYAVDIQEAMHDHYREKGVPDNVDLVTSGVDDLPLDTDSLDAAFSTMTYHEFASDSALGEITRVLKPEGTFVVVDWAASGSGDHGPPVDERFSTVEATDALRQHGFSVEFEAVRPETFLLIASTDEQSSFSGRRVQMVAEQRRGRLAGLRIRPQRPGRNALTVRRRSLSSPHCLRRRISGGLLR